MYTNFCSPIRDRSTLIRGEFMTVMDTERFARLGDIFVGFPEQLLPAQTLATISRFYSDLDAIGRVDDSNPEPTVDELTLLAMLREFAGEEKARLLVEELLTMP